MAIDEENSDIVDGPVGEDKSVKARKKKVTEALLSSGINITENSNPPVIAVLGSGGGLRAMIGFLGTLSKLAELNLLDCVTYVGGTSGSTWCMASLYPNKNWTEVSCMKDLESQLCEQIKSESKRDWKESCKRIKEIFLGEMYSLTDLWAYVIVFQILNKINKETLSGHKDGCENGKNPYPVYSAVDKENIHINNSGAWFEFTPHLSGFPAYKTYIQIERLGSKFEGGRVLEEYPEMELAYLQGMWGSALGDSVHNLIYSGLQSLISSLHEEVSHLCKTCKTVKEILLNEMKMTDINETCWQNAAKRLKDYLESPECTLDKDHCNPTVDTPGDMENTEDLKSPKVESEENGQDPTLEYSENPKHARIEPAVVSFISVQDICENAKVVWNIVNCLAHWRWGTTNNFLYQWENKIPDGSEISTKKDIALIDAGLEINTPYPLMLPPHRKVDLFLSFDFSEGGPFKTVNLAAEYCKKYDIPFPPINMEDNDDIPSKSCYIFEREAKDGKEMPCIMHFPQFNTETCEDEGKAKEMRNTYGTLVMSYDEAKLKDLLDLAKKNVENNKDQILEKMIQCVQMCN